MPLPKDKDELAFAIGYKGLTPSAMTILQLNKIYINKSDHSLNPSTQEEIKTLLHMFDSYSNENNINLDLSAMEKLYEINLRRKTESENCTFMAKLFKIAYPCAKINEPDKIETISPM